MRFPFASMLTITLLSLSSSSIQAAGPGGGRYVSGTQLQGTGRYVEGTQLRHNTDGTRPRISFQPFSQAAQDFTLIQLTEGGKRVPILNVSLDSNQVPTITTLSFEGEQPNDAVQLVKGIWRFKRDENIENPQGTLIQPGKLNFAIMYFKKSKGPFTQQVIKPLSTKSAKTYFTLQPEGGEMMKLEAINFNVNESRERAGVLKPESLKMLVKYAKQGEVSPPSETGIAFDEAKHGFLKKLALLQTVLRRISNYQDYLSKQEKYQGGRADSMTFQVSDDVREQFLYELAQDYLEALFRQAPEHQKVFLTMDTDERQALADSLISWLREVKIEPLGQRLLTLVEMKKFQQAIRKAVANLVQKIRLGRSEKMDLREGVLTPPFVPPGWGSGQWRGDGNMGPSPTEARRF